MTLENFSPVAFAPRLKDEDCSGVMNVEGEKRRERN